MYITSHHITPHHTTSHHITSHHITPHHTTSHRTTPHHITSHHTTPHHITSHHTTSHHITTPPTTPHHITSPHHPPHHTVCHTAGVPSESHCRQHCTPTHFQFLLKLFLLLLQQASLASLLLLLHPSHLFLPLTEVPFELADTLLNLTRFSGSCHRTDSGHVCTGMSWCMSVTCANQVTFVTS